MPILRPPYPGMFPAGYSGSQIIRSGVMEDPEQRLYPAGDTGLYGHKNLGGWILGFQFFSATGNLSASIGMHAPQNLPASIIGSYCQTISPKRYVIGYEDGTPQFLETRQRYQCVSILSAYLKSFAHTSKNLPTAIKPTTSTTRDLGTFIISGHEIFSEYRDLPGLISGYGTLPGSISASIAGVQCQSLGPQQYVIGYEDGTPQFLSARDWYRCVSFLSAYVKSRIQATKDLPATITPSRSETRDLGTFIIAGHEIFSEYRDLGAILTGFETLPGSISASIVGTYCQTLFGKRYFVGYEDGVPQYIDGRTTYRCVDFLPARINQVWYEDLAAFIWGQPIFHEQKDLPAYINGRRLQEYKDLGALIYPPVDLPAFIHGFDTRDLLAYLRAFMHDDLPGNISPIPPVDLPGYLKVWPMDHLPGIIHGWQEADLGAQIDWNIADDLPASIGAHPPRNLGALLKGWVREATSDLGGNITGFTFDDLGGIIRAKYFENLGGYVFPILPKDLGAFIHGWDTKDLPAYIAGVYGANDLQAYINAYNQPVDLPAFVQIRKGVQIPRDLRAYAYGATILDQQENLGASISMHAPADLSAYLVVQGGSGDLGATILPKIIQMTTIIDLITKEHSDLNALINVCVSSEYRNLAAFLQCSYIADLPASIEGTKNLTTYRDLVATIGYADSYISVDKLPISVEILSGYINEDKLPIYVRIFTQQSLLRASITGTYLYDDLGAQITGTWLDEYEFDATKHTERVNDINIYGQVDWYELVEMAFSSIVDDYFYVDGENKVYKGDRLLKWVLDMRSYIPENEALGIRRKLHRVKKVHDISRFSTIDEAIRYYINWLTESRTEDLSAFINPSGGFSNLQGRITPKYFTTQTSDLASSVQAVQKTFVVGLDDEIDFY